MPRNNRTRIFGLVLFILAVRLAAASDKVSIRHVQSISLSERPDHIALSDDKTTIAVTTGETITAIHRPTKSRKQWKDNHDIVDLDVTANGQLLAVATGGTNINVYETRTGKLIQQVHRRDALSFLRNDGQRKVCFFPDGTKLASMGGSKRAYISDVKTGDWDYIAWVKQPRSTPLVSPGGKFIAIFGPPHEYEQSGQLLMFKVRRGLQPMWTRFHTGQNAATSAAFSPQAKRIASCGAGDGVRIWEVESGKPIAHLQMDSAAPVLEVCFVDAGELILIATTTELQLRAINSNKFVARHALTKPIKTLSATPNGDNFITSGEDTDLRVWAIDKE